MEMVLDMLECRQYDVNKYADEILRCADELEAGAEDPEHISNVRVMREATEWLKREVADYVEEVREKFLNGEYS
ncbi:hypothetical protein FACS18949_05890 [Clostridia bacterium]|nr:hypothetical protein FACS18949_05890 [Clostridia bacterium]